MVKRWLAGMMAVLMLPSVPLAIGAEGEDAVDNTITVDFSQTNGEMNPKTGWLLIPNETVPDGRILPLNTRVVRDDIDTQNLLGNNGNSNDQKNLQDWVPNEQNRLQRMKHGVERLQSLGIQQYYPIMGYFSSWVSQNGMPRSTPADYDAWRQWVKDIAQYSLDNDLPISEFNVWNEFWSINDTHFSRMYEQAWHAVREVSPEFELVGPSPDNPNLGSIQRLAKYCAEHDITLDNISWHFGDYTKVGEFQQSVAESVAELPTIGDPDYYYEEYTKGADMLKMGPEMTTLANFDDADIDEAIRAIWRWTNGLSDQLEINYSKQNPYARQNVWWLMTSYGSMSGVRIKRQGDAPYVASYDAEKGEAKVLVGGTYTQTTDMLLKNNLFAGQNIRIDRYKITNVENDGLQFQSSEQIANAPQDISTSVDFNGDVWMLVIKKDDSIPSDFALKTPDDGLAVSGYPTFSWQPSQGADSYDLEIAETADFSQIVYSKTGITGESFKMDRALDFGKQYYWRVVAKNQFGERAPYNHMYYTFTYALLNTIPGRFTMLQVIDEDPNTSLTPKFTWTPAYGATGYTIHISTDASFAEETTIAVTDPGTVDMGQNNKYQYYQLTVEQALQPETVYYAYLTATNSSGDRVMAGDPHMFTTTTADGAPAAFRVSEPANGATVDPRFTLRWEPSHGAFFYCLEIAKDPEFTDVVLKRDTITIQAYTMEENILEPETTYYWRVTATDKVGGEGVTATPGDKTCVNANGVQSFTTSKKPTSPLMRTAVSASGGAVVYFQPVDDAEVYRVKYGTVSGQYDHQAETTTPSAYLSLKAGVPYYCTVVAVRNGVESEQSKEVSVVGYDTELTIATDTPLEAELFPVRDNIGFQTADNPSAGVAVEFRDKNSAIELSPMPACQTVTLQYQADQDTSLALYNGETKLQTIALDQTAAGEWASITVPASFKQDDTLRLVKETGEATARVDYVVLGTEALPERGNLAPSATVSADSFMNDNYSAARVNDEKLAGDKDFWVAKNTPTEQSPNWVVAKLASTSEVYRVEIALPPLSSWGARTQSIRVLASDDGITYREISARRDCLFDLKQNNNRVTVFESDTPLTTAYIKVEIYSNTVGNVGQIGELFIDGLALDQPVPDANLALGKPLTVGATHYGNPENINDGNQSSFWDGGNSTFPNSVTVDLQRAYTLERVEMLLPANWGDRNQEMEIFVSTDNETFTSVVEKTSYLFSASQKNTVTLTMPEGTVARYLRVVGYSNDEKGKPGVQLGELRVFGSYTPVDGVTLQPESCQLKVGETLPLTATVTPAAAESKALAWSSSDNAVATVDNNGVVTARGTGSCEIRVRTLDGRYTATCAVTVDGYLGTPGDVDGDGAVTVMDALLALQATAGKVELTEPQQTAADVDGTAGVSAADALMILQYATKQRTTFSDLRR